MAYDPERDPENRDPQKPESVEASQDNPAQAAESGAREATDGTDKKRSADTSERPRRSESRARASDDDDDYDDEEDEEEEERERRRAAARRRAKSRGSRGSKRKLNIPKTEEELNVPKIQTIGMLGSVSVLMIIMWFAAKLACNAHPDHLREPRYVSVEQLARDPKNAALEFQLRFVSKDYLLAGEIAAKSVADKVHELLSFCEANMDACEKDRLALKDKVTGTAALIETVPSHAVVEVTTYVNGEDPKTVTLDVAPFGQVWKVTQTRDGAAVGAAPTAPSTAP